MTMGNKVLLGVTGCIAAYKACEIVRGLQKSGCEVEVVMTENACRFVGPHTFAALTGLPVRTDAFGSMDDPIPHIRMAEGCDLFLIAPCTGNVIAKVACGIADDLLTSCALAAHDRLVVAPAMNVRMYESPATQRNLSALKDRGVRVVEPESGRLACGDVGKGRLADVGLVVGEALDELARRGLRARPGGEGGGLDALEGMTVLVTAGPTVEWIDPVRYVSNPSTGKMGYAVARAAAGAGAKVVLVSGPVSLEAPEGVNLVRVETAEEMLRACEGAFGGCDVAVFAAAVSDFRPSKRFGRKLKKPADARALSVVEMEENPDVLAALASRKKPGQFVVGFAAETEDVVRNARAKLASKGADMIVANKVGPHEGFGEDGNAAVMVSAKGEEALPYMPKSELARKILEAACDNFKVC